jgi:hypothetical protein
MYFIQMLRASFFLYIPNLQFRPTGCRDPAAHLHSPVLPFEDLVKSRTATLRLTVWRSVGLSVLVSSGLCTEYYLAGSAVSDDCASLSVAINRLYLSTVHICIIHISCYTLYVFSVRKPAYDTHYLYYRCQSWPVHRTVPSVTELYCKGDSVICTVVNLESRHV